jgi:pimeloyl-ACP methyl ester carboxylesterase
MHMAKATKMEKALNVADHKCPSLIYKNKGTPIVLLHGFSYTAEIWQKIGLTKLLMEKRVPFLALDMPYGLKSRCHPKTRDVQINLSVLHKAIVEVFGNTSPVLVGASLGGFFALNYAAKYPVKGLMVVAPADALAADLQQAYNTFTFSTRVVWGSMDSIISGEEMRTLTGKLPNAKLLVYQGAAHSAYQDQPEQFKHDLLELYANSE